MFFSLFTLAAAQPGVYYAFSSSDRMGKFIVWLLIVSSVVTWTIMADKWLALRRAKIRARYFAARFKEHHGAITANALVQESQLCGGPTGEIYSAGVQKLIYFYENTPQTAQAATNSLWQQPGVELSQAQIEAIETVLDCQISHLNEDLETNTGILATMVSLSPFLGLFGTVWGVMMAFCGIAIAGRADFSALAPGVGGALLTTVAGLLVAIPSLVGYNMINGSIRQLSTMMDNFAEEFMSRLKLEQVDITTRNARSAER